MTAPSRCVLRVLSVLGLLLGSVLLATPASAAEKVITVTAEGVSPKVLQVAKGDTVRFVLEDRSRPYRAVSTSDNWSFDSGPLGLLDGDYLVEQPITAPGTYTYRVADGEAYAGSAALAAPASPRPSAGGSTAKPSPAAGGAPSPSGGAARPGGAGGTGGSGSAAAPPLAAGFGPVLPVPSPVPGGVALPPAVAPPAAGLPSAVPLPSTAPVPTPAPVTALAVPGDLRGADTAREVGLPAALAAVLAAGTASLLVRLLLAEPSARRARTGFARPAPVATVD